MPRAACPSGRKSLRLLALAASIIVGGAWWWQRPPPEPVHNGQRLSEWLTVDGALTGLAPSVVPVQAFGPAAVPWLTYMLEHGRHPVIKHGPLPFDNAPEWLRRLLPNKWGGLRGVSLDDERIKAIMALEDFGPEAAPAIPAVVRCLEANSENDETRISWFAANLLHFIGPASWPVVEQAIEHGSPRSRAVLLERIWLRFVAVKQPVGRTEAPKVLAALLNGCGDPNALVRLAAVSGLSGCHDVLPDLFDSAIPALIRLLSDSDRKVRKSAANALIGSGNKAAKATPRLIEMLSDQEASLRGVAARALGAVDTVEKISAARLRVMSRDDPDEACRTAAWLALGELGFSQEYPSSKALPTQ